MEQNAITPEKKADLVEAVRNMRRCQKEYFSAPQGTAAKTKALTDSKYWERLTDNLLKDLESGQLPLL